MDYIKPFRAVFKTPSKNIFNEDGIKLEASIEKSFG